MGLKELREKFHEKDSDFSSHFHKNENGVKKPSWGKIIITWLITVFVLLIIAGSISNAIVGTPTTSNVDESYNYTTNAEPQISEGEYKAAATTISFKQLDKNPDSYIGKKVKYTGTVLEIQESGGTGIMRVAIDGDYNKIIYVTYTGTNDAVEDDTVTIWGEVYGSYSYTSQANYEISLPRIDAKYVEVVG